MNRLPRRGAAPNEPIRFPDEPRVASTLPTMVHGRYNWLIMDRPGSHRTPRTRPTPAAARARTRAALLVLDAAGCVQDANAAAESLLGRSTATLRTRRLWFAGVVARRSRPALMAMARALARDAAVPPVNLEVTDGAGAAIPVRVHVRVESSAHGAPEVHAILRRRPRRSATSERLRQLAVQRESLRETEKRLLARRLHDELAQPMSALGLHLGGLRQTLARGGTAVEATTVEAMERQVSGMVASLQTLMHGLRPSVLDDFGLPAAVRRETEEFAARTGIACAVAITLDADACDSRDAIAVFRLVQEALAETLRRRARTVRVELAARDAAVVLTVRDDGAALAVAPLPAALAYRRDQLAAQRGALEILSHAAGAVAIRVRLPVRRAERRTPQGGRPRQPPARRADS